jgi:hypothetical protein
MSPEPYAALVALAERERELIAEGRLEALEDVWAERDALVAGLPARPPASVRPLLERAARLQSEISATLAGGIAALEAELARLTRGRGSVRAYTPAAVPAPPRSSWTG